jgi:hypothetical protein
MILLKETRRTLTCRKRGKEKKGGETMKLIQTILGLFKRKPPSKESLLEKKFSDEFGTTLMKFTDGDEFCKKLLSGAIMSAPFNPQKAVNALTHCGKQLNTRENVDKLKRLNTWYCS